MLNIRKITIFCTIALLLCVGINSAESSEGDAAPIPACKDKFPGKCKAWESTGECEASREYMVTVCPRACGVCVPESPVSGCEDQHKSCHGWGSRGECAKRPSYMNVYCPKTCNTCPPTEPLECVDQHELCFLGAMLGECKNNPSFFKTFCAHSCRSVMPHVCAQDKSAVQEVCAHQFSCGIDYDIHRSRTRRSKTYEEDDSVTPDLHNREEYAKRFETATSVLKELGEEQTAIENAMEELEDFHLLPRNSRILDDIGINRDMSNKLWTATSVEEKAEVIRSFMHKDSSQSDREGRFLGSTLGIDTSFCTADSSIVSSSLLTDIGLNWCTAAATLLLLVGPTALAVHQNRERQASKYNAPPRLPLNEINHPYAIRTHFNVYTAVPDPAPVYAVEHEPVSVKNVETIETTPISDVTVAEQEKVLLDIDVNPIPDVTVTEPKKVLLDVDVRVKQVENLPDSIIDEESPLPEILDDPTKREVSYHPSIKSLVPFCTIQGYLDLVKRLEPLVGENTGRPLTPLAASLALAINYCQYGTGSADVVTDVPVAPEQFKIEPSFSILTDDIQKPHPPKRWPGLSFPSLNEFQESGPTSKPTTEAMPLVLMLLFNNSVVATNDTSMDGIIVDVDNEEIAEALNKNASPKIQADLQHSEINASPKIQADLQHSEINASPKIQADLQHSEINTEFLNSTKEIPKVETESSANDGSTEKSVIISEETIQNIKNKTTSKDKISKIKIPNIKPITLSKIRTSSKENIGSIKEKPKSNNNLPNIGAEDTLVVDENDYDAGTETGAGAFTIGGNDFNSDFLKDMILDQNAGFDIASEFGEFGTRRNGRSHTYEKASRKGYFTQDPYRHRQSYGQVFNYGLKQSGSSYNFAEDRVDADVGGQVPNSNNLIGSSFACGGAQITPYHMLTAAHCILQDGRLPSLLRLGEVDSKILDEDIVIDYDVQDVAIHPGYRLPERYNDLAIITLKQKMEFSTSVHPYCLPSDPIDHQGNLFSISGWGTLQQGVSSVLPDVNATMVSRTDCSESYMLKGRDYNPAFTTQYPQGISQQLVCAAHQDENICRGDSGGPLIVSDSSGRQEVVGIGSATDGSCTEDSFPTIYTRVHEYIEWINDVIYGGCDVI